jgi:hypothetical protein
LTIINIGRKVNVIINNWGSLMKTLFRAVFNLVNLVIEELDSMTIFALLMAALGVAIASAQEVGAAAVIGGWGLSPKLLGLVLTFSGMLIIRFGNYRIFSFLTLPYVIYLVALIQYASTTTTSFAPIVVYTGCYLLALRMGVKDKN